MIPRFNFPRLHSLALGLAAALTTTVLMILVAALVPDISWAVEPRDTNSTPGTQFQIERGRYLVSISACNDCHTRGYAASGGELPESEWLLGSDVGFQGPWGTSYPANLRLTVASMSEPDWLTFARARRLPPMPWFALRDMDDSDLRAVYHFIRSLGARGDRAPAAVGRGIAVTTPYIDFTTRGLPAPAARTVPGRRGAG